VTPIDLVGAGVLTATAGLYGAGTLRVWRTAGGGRLVHPANVWCFLAGLVVIEAATLGPLDGLAASSVSGHMAQHVVLIGLAPPLLALGAAPAAFGGLARVAHRGRRRVVALTRGRAWLGAVAVAAAVHAVAMVVWHLPGPFSLAEEHPVTHLAEHGSFVATGAVLWWLVLAARSGRYLAVAVIVAFGETMTATGLGALITFATRPWYRGHPDLVDQQVAGVVMWAYGGLIGLATALGAFVAWLRADSRAEAAARSRHTR
jgi:putative membrane protein